MHVRHALLPSLLLAPLATLFPAQRGGDAPPPPAAPDEPQEEAPREEGTAEEAQEVPITAIPLEAQSFLPQAGALFGHAVLTLDFDGDGVHDLAVGAPGESAVYLLLGPGFDRAQRFQPQGAQAGDEFGYDLAAGELDGQPGEDIVVGAPGRTVDGVGKAGRLYLISKRLPRPVALTFAELPAGRLGNSVAVADLDGDGNVDLAAGAPKALLKELPSGATAVVSLRPRKVVVIPNPQGPWRHGNYGHDLAAGDGDGDGTADLFVSGIGNRSTGGVRGAGQVFVHLRPMSDEPETIVVQDPRPKDGDPARFGMSIGAGDIDQDGDCDLIVGAPRKDGGGVMDAGAGYLFLGPEFSGADCSTLVHPGAEPHDILGFRARIADVVGDERPEVVLVSLAAADGGALVVWPAKGLEGPPVLYTKPEGGSHHFVQGLQPGPALPGVPRTLALGDPNFDPGGKPDAGRVLVVSLGD